MNAGLVLRYYHTLRHLKPEQIYGRLWFRWSRPKLRRSAVPSPRGGVQGWRAPMPKRPSMLGPTRFEFLNQTGDCATATDWNNPKREKLWLYNLHYFDDLSAAGAADRPAWHSGLIARWIDENPPTAGNGWEPYPTSLRVVNWIKWARAGNTPPPKFNESLGLQVRWLAKRVERHLLANHLFANAKALVVAGLYFDGEEARAWREHGLTILSRELSSQVLRDGGHVELSPMYHGIILEDLLDLINAAQSVPGLIDDETVARWTHAVARMHGWALAMSHPDGRIAFFNDAAFDVAPTAAELAAYADRLGVSVPDHPTALSESGYVRVEHGSAVLIADLAQVGADYQPGHAHADTLSFELSLGGNRVFVNTGTSTYQPGAQRAFERSTAAHNTVEIDSADSSEVWGGFRVARRARPLDVHVRDADGGTRVFGGHDGYRRLPGKPAHWREWLLENHRVRVTDRITGKFDRAVARFFLHPSVDARPNGLLTLPSGETCRWSVTGGYASIAGAQWHPRFGVSETTRCIEVVFQGSEVVFELAW